MSPTVIITCKMSRCYLKIQSCDITLPYNQNFLVYLNQIGYHIRTRLEIKNNFDGTITIIISGNQISSRPCYRTITNKKSSFILVGILSSTLYIDFFLLSTFNLKAREIDYCKIIKNIF